VPARRGSSRDGRFRPDIEGLRAVAVVAVVVFHAGAHFVSGGYIGVDVFYVISGFLITDHLWREVGRDGRLSFAAFYARRVRRLLPAAIFVLVATVAASAAILPPLQMRSVWKDALSCALYAGNFRFAATRTDYLADTTPSPFQHYWSLGVEEQFYLLWPLVLLVVSLVLWRRRPSRPTALAGLGAIVVASFALSVHLTKTDQPVAFFLLPTRAWELGLGGLIALAAPELRRVPSRTSAVVGWAGLGAIGLACVIFGPSTAFPGRAALLPVVGTGAVIASGLSAPVDGPVRLLGRVGMRAMGRISYSWYLWHYPVLILVPLAVGRILPLAAMLALATGSGLLAVLTYRFVEQPARLAPAFSSSSRLSLSAGLALSSAGALAAAGAALAIPTLHGHGVAPIATIHAGPSIPSTPGAGSTPTSPAQSALQSAEAQVVGGVTRSAATKDVPANLAPPLSSAAASEAAPDVDGCLVSYTSSRTPDCLFGDTSADRSIVLFGDSHAAMWFPSVDAYANSAKYRLIVMTKAACPPVAITVFSPVLDRTWTECSEWYAHAMARIADLHPTLVVLGIAPNYDAAYHLVQNGPQWLSGLKSTITSIRAGGSRALVIGSAPGPVLNVPDCLSAHLTDVPACDFSPIGHRVSGGGLVGLDLPGDAAEAAAARAAGAVYADVWPWFCTSNVCDVIVDNLLAYRDISHITVPFADYLAPLVGDEMSAALTG
jgi:peptidoglycan/LPS O-acetylase OafA/YrhL